MSSAPPAGSSNDNAAATPDDADAVAESYRARGYDSTPVGFGEKLGIVVVDFQRANTDPAFALGGAPLVERAVVNTARLLAVARCHQVPIASCYMAWKGPEHGPDDTPYTKIRIGREDFRHGHPCTEIDARVLDPRYDLVVCKPGISILFQTPVLPFFIRQRVDTVVVTGCNTSGCVRGTVIDAFQHGYRTLIPEDCVGDIEEEPHRRNLADMERRYADVISAADVVAHLEGQAGG
ncbi:MAG: isochorismatase family protein [Azospirillaceae bacterium]